MSTVLAALAPVFGLIVLGSVIKRFGWIDDAWWPLSERMTYYLFFPSLLLYGTASADLGGVPIGPLIAALVGGVLGVALLGTLLRPLLGVDGPAFTSVYQGLFRPNTYVGVAAAEALFGTFGVGLVSVCIAIVVPLVNLLSVLAMLRHARDVGPKPGIGRTLGELARNPLILAPLAGIGLNAAGLGLPPVIEPLLATLGRAALPIGLLAVGAGLDLGALKGAGRAVAASTITKLMVLPALTWGLCQLSGLGSQATVVAVMYASLPVSASSYVLAGQMGGNARLMAGIITASTLGAMATMPAILVWLNA